MVWFAYIHFVSDFILYITENGETPRTAACSSGSLVLFVLMVVVVPRIVAIVIVSIFVARWLLIRTAKIVVLETTLGASVFVTAVVEIVAVLWGTYAAVLPMVVMILLPIRVVVVVFLPI